MNAEAITNPAAEWSIVAAMLSDSSLIGEVVGTQLAADDFIRADAKLLYATSVERYYSESVVEPLSVVEPIRPRLAELWGVAEQAVPDTLLERIRDRDYGAGVLEHASIVRRLSTARSLLSVCEGAVSAIGLGDRTPEEIAGQLSTDALAATSGAVARTELSDWMDLGRDYARFLHRQRLARAEGIELAVYTGLPFIDEYTKGIAPGELLFMAGAPGSGKALALDTPIPTPWGWTTMGEVGAGWMVLGSDGSPVAVDAVSEVMHGRRCYRVTFSDGAHIIADAEHQWQTTTRLQRVGDGRPGVVTTEEIAGTLRREDGGFNHRIQNHPGLALPDVDLPVDPYVLGVWLGDGTTRTGHITIGEQDRDEMVGLLRDAGAVVRQCEPPERHLIEGLGDLLFRVGVLHDKHIPDEYLRASDRQRRALFAGLVDSDGSVSESGRIDFSVTLEALALGFVELARSLGMKPTLRRSKAMLDGRFAGWRYRIGVTPSASPGRLERKRRLTARRGVHDGRFIVSVTPVPSRPVKCLRVRSADSLFLAGDAMIPTHNSILGWKAAEGFAARQMKKPEEQRVATLVVSMEMGNVPSATRLAQSITGLDGMRLREGDITDREYQLILAEWKARDGLPIHFNFASNFRLSQLRALIVEAIRRHNVGFVILDHFRQIDTDSYVRDPNDRDEQKARFLKESICKDLNVAMLCIAHIVKLGGSDPNRRPRLDDLRGSGTIGANADFVGLLHRPAKNLGAEEQMALSMDDKDAEVIWAKARFTSDGTAHLSIDAARMTVKPR